MAYTINLTNGTEIVAGGLSDGAVDTSATSITLIGKNYAGYGEFLNENLVHMLEHFASGTGPPNPLKGQLWWDTTNNILKVYSGVSWKISTGATSAPFSSPPGDLSALGGDLWFDSTNQQLKIYSGSAWITVGPVATPATGDTGAFPSIMTDTSGGSHIVTQIRIAGVPYVIISKDTFTSSLAGFSTVKAGINFSTIAAPTMVLSTQDTAATNNTLVQRDSSAGITGAAIIGTVINGTTSITSPSIIATTGFTGNLAGNVTATSISATGITGTGITALSGYTGTLLTASQPNITNLGTLTGLNVNGTVNINGDVAIVATTATLNGSPIARIGDPANFSSINNTPIGNAVPSTGAFTTLTASGQTNTAGITSNGTIIASTVQAGTIGNSGATLTGTLSTASQPNITTATALVSVGNITTGTWSGTVVQPQYGGTGVNNGTNTLTLTGSFRLNQNVEVNSSPTLRGTNFNSIPNGALVNNSIVINGTSVALGGTYSSSIVGSVTGTANQIIVSAPSGNIVLSTPQDIGTASSVRFGSLGIGTAASGTTGEIRATNNITAYYSSDQKFKENIQVIPDALNKVAAIGGKTFDWTDEYIQSHGGADGYFITKSDYGVVAQDVQAVFPQAVRTKPDGTLAVDYQKLSALAFAAIVELKAEIDQLKSKLK